MKAIDKNKFFIALLVILHGVGIAGLTSSYQKYFLLLTPLNLLISLGILIRGQTERNKNFIIFCCILFDLGYLVEVAGVHTGMIFGSYAYGSTLGLKLFDVPLIIGVNWLLLVMSAGNILDKHIDNIYVKSLTGASMLTLLDVLIEPVATKLDFWSWENDLIPLQNYIAWFILSFFFLFIFNKFQFGKNNLPAKALYIIQLAFFAALNMI